MPSEDGSENGGVETEGRSRGQKQGQRQVATCPNRYYLS